MKTMKDAIIERLSRWSEVTADGQEPDADLRQTLAENRAFEDLASIGAPPPDRRQMVTGALGGTPQRAGVGRVVWQALAGSRPVQLAALSVAAVLAVVVVFFVTPGPQPEHTPMLSLASAQPAWAAESGVVLSQQLGELKTADARALKSQIEELVRTVLKGHGGAPRKLDSELDSREDGYNYRLALPGIKREAAEEIRAALSEALSERMGSELSQLGGGLDDVMFLLEDHGLGGTGRNWAPMSELPDPLKLNEQLKRLLEQQERLSDVSIEVDRIGDQVALRISSDEDLSFSGPLGDYDGREVLELRESQSGEPTGSFHTSSHSSYSQSFTINGEPVSAIDSDNVPEAMREFMDRYQGGNGTFSYSMQMSSSSSSSSSSHSSEHSSSSGDEGGHGYARGGGGGGGYAGGGGGGSAGGGGGPGSEFSIEESSSSEHGGGGSGGGPHSNSGSGSGSGHKSGGGSASGSGSGGSGGSKMSGGGSGGGSSTGGGGLPALPEGMGQNGAFSEHYELMRQYIAEHYADSDYEMNSSGSGDTLTVELTRDGKLETLTIAPGDDGKLAITAK